MAIILRVPSRAPILCHLIMPNDNLVLIVEVEHLPRLTTVFMAAEVIQPVRHPADVGAWNIKSVVVAVADL